MEQEIKVIPEKALLSLATQEARIRRADADFKMEQQRGQELITAIGAALGIENFKDWKRSDDGKAFIKLAVKGAE